MAKKKAVEVVKKKMLWKEFAAEIEQIGPRQYGEFRGTKTKVHSLRQRVWKHVKGNDLKLLCYVVTHEDKSLSLFVVGVQ